jgi:hypothetical protein
VSFSSALPPIFKTAMSSTMSNIPQSELPKRLVTQTLPWLSMPRPLPLYPLLNFSTLLGSAAENRVTCAPKPLVTQIRFCWSMPRWNGPTNDLQGSTSLPSQRIRPLLQSPLGKCSSWFFEIPTAHTSPPGVAMMPCINPSWPLKVIPSGGVSGLPFLSNTAIDFPP